LSKIKFSHPTVAKAVKEIFGSNEYRRVLVVWDVEDAEVIEQARSKYRIEVWRIENLMNQLALEVKTKPYRDDVLRTIQLISGRIGKTTQLTTSNRKS
jgi:sulfite reductase beta subunit-like hemoprotein